ncbi:MAG: hypothetical protein JXB48_19085 [Candidatus Latescibacteria bacterium]|nr:hypothetical protein [Candidatus Latescibacterota bacterium]
MSIYGREQIKIYGSFIVCMFLFIPESLAINREQYYEYSFSIQLPQIYDTGFNLKEETRYKSGNIYYRKTFIGVSKPLFHHTHVAIYFAWQEFKTRDWKNLYIVWPEIINISELGKVKLIVNTKFERHTTQHFWKIRQKWKFQKRVGKLFHVWSGYEYRYFINENYSLDHEFLAGTRIQLTTNFATDIYYDFRNIRMLGQKEKTHCVRTFFEMSF